MAKSPAHQWGQIIGEVLENTVAPFLEEFATRQGLYLDRKGPRKARTGKKVSWTDLNGNKHDLDFVFEKGGTETQKGMPVALIETAWRRYTKHSRNKAQEIQGAVIPLAETYRDSIAFIGAILAGEFTGDALQQLRSLGFTLLYLPYDSVLRAFRVAGIDATFDEDTSDSEFTQKVHAWEALADSQRSRVMRALVDANAQRIDTFMQSLANGVARLIEFVRLLPVHGTSIEWSSIGEAINFIADYDEGQSAKGAQPFVRYEVQIRYVTGAKVVGEFTDKDQAVEFLRRFS